MINVELYVPYCYGDMQWSRKLQKIKSAYIKYEYLKNCTSQSAQRGGRAAQPTGRDEREMNKAAAFNYDLHS